MDPLSQHTRETSTTGRGGSNVAMIKRQQLSHVREELQRGVRFTQFSERPTDDDIHAMPHQHIESNDSDEALWRAGDSSPSADEDGYVEAFGELALTDDGHELSHRASSFSGSRMVPCSPPVPIPQKHWQRRKSTPSTSGSHSSSAGLIPSHDHQYSRTQCEARLWDEYWNYKLSLESRESFEASSTNNQRDGHESTVPGKADLQVMGRTMSEASTDDTAQDSSDDMGEANVFDMDDL